MKSSVTISLVPEARGGPFIFWDDLDSACAEAAQIGFDAVEIFPPGPEVLGPDRVLPLVQKYGLKVAAIGTGAGWLKHRFSLTSRDQAIRTKAKNFIRSIIEKASPLKAPVIIGSMQGRFDGDVTRQQALGWLAEALRELGNFAAQNDTFLLYEFLNRYETNLLNRLDDSVKFVRETRAENVRILADLFHMNIEEQSIPDAIKSAGEMVGHVHFADSNRRPVGLGHTSIQEIIDALRAINYQGYLSAEALPYPSPREAAEQTIKAFRKYVR